MGSTGSIGTQALDIVRNRPNDFKVKALSAGLNLDLLIEQIKEFKPEFVTIQDDEHKKELASLFPNLEILQDIKELAQLDGVDIFLSAIVGIAGLEANLLALQHASRVAVANKETLVSAGHIVRDYCQRYGSELIPVDSEHAAIHQCLSSVQGDAKENSQEYFDRINATVDKILLTSSGGPFRARDINDFASITMEDALKHPTWSMGAKITVDSSTLMNKALEVIEVNSLFDIDYDQIQVVIHPQSIVHSAVQFKDGNTIAQMGSPNMRVPIQYALDYPERKALAVPDDFDIFKTQTMEFFEPDTQKFPAIDLAYKVGKLGGSYPTVFNSANEAAVELFLDKKIHYMDIYKMIESTVEKHQIIKNPSIEDVLTLDREIRAKSVLQHTP